MTSKIVLAAPAGGVRERLCAGFSKRGFEVAKLNRESFVAEGCLIIEDGGVRLRGEDVSREAAGAVILDSGYMWPVPLLSPTREEWEANRTCFDDYLRADRESASLWFSALALLGEHVPHIANPQSAFAYQAMKPQAFLELRDRGLATADFAASNDPEVFHEMVRKGEEARLTDLLGQSPPRWIDAAAVDALPLDEEAFVVQRLGSKELTEVVVAGKTCFEVRGSRADSTLVDLAREALGALGAPLGRVVFGRDPDGRRVVVDFDITGGLGALSEGDMERVVDGLAELFGGAGC